MTDSTLPPVKKQGHGCFFYGCIISLIILVLFLVGVFMMVRFVASTVHNFTQAASAPLPAVELPPTEMKQLEDRIAAFNSALKAHTNTPPLVLTSRDINGLIAASPDLKNKCLVTLDADKIKGEISLPLDPIADSPVLKYLHLKGRFLNGGATFHANIESGKLGVYIDTLEVGGKPISDSYLVGIRQQNLADGFNQGTNADAFAQYESLQVTNSTIVVKAKQP